MNSFFVFALLWKTDLNFVSRFLSLWKTDLNFVCRFGMTWKTDHYTSSVIWSPGHPLGVYRGIHFLCNWKEVNFPLSGAKVSSKLPPPLMICLTHTRYSLFLTMDDKWYDDSREKTRRYRNTCISSMEKESDKRLKTLQLEVTKCEVTKNYKSSFTVFWSFCRMTQLLQVSFLPSFPRYHYIIST